MSQNELTAKELISLGINLLTIEIPKRPSLSEYRLHAHDLVNRLRLGGFTHSLSLAEVLLKEVEKYDADPLRGQGMFLNHETEFRTTASAIDRVMVSEAAAKTLILTDAKPPDAVAQLTDLEDHQQALFDDMVTCFKAHLARPAIVMAWALGYDIVRWWVHSEPARLAAFNAQYKNGPIVEYSDFFGIGEKLFLDTCKNAQTALSGFNEKTHSALFHLLIDRNRFAHANFSEATPNRAAAYVEKMVETVTGPPFK